MCIVYFALAYLKIKKEKNEPARLLSTDILGVFSLGEFTGYEKPIISVSSQAKHLLWRNRSKRSDLKTSTLIDTTTFVPRF